MFVNVNVMVRTNAFIMLQPFNKSTVYGIILEALMDGLFDAEFTDLQFAEASLLD
jgi:hypothetical protein